MILNIFELKLVTGINFEKIDKRNKAKGQAI
jgi:hypothetical protein